MPKAKALAINPAFVMLGRPEWRVKLAELILDTLIEVFPDFPANGYYYGLRDDGHYTEITLNLAERTQLKISVTEDNSRNRLALAMVTAPEIDHGVIPSNNIRSYERMALNAACDTDILGWIYVAKSFVDNKISEPVLYQATQTLQITDYKTGEVEEIRPPTVFQVHPTQQGIRHKIDADLMTNLEHPSWTRIAPESIEGMEEAHAIVRLENGKARVVRYKIHKRIAFFCTRRNQGVNFKKGDICDVLTDLSAIRLTTEGLSLDPADTSWIRLDSTQGMKRALLSGDVQLTTEEPRAVMSLADVDDILGGIK